jgi:uncharacterized protein (DUF983 family)
VSGAATLEFDCDGHDDRPFAVTVAAEPVPASADCPACGRARVLHPEVRTDGGGLLGCAACGHPELYRQKDFPRALGLAIVIVAAILAPFTWYLSLVAAALADCVLYFLGADRLVCYLCRARHRGFAPDPRHPRFDREIEERLKFGQRAVMGKPMRPGGTAGAPEPEH